MCTKANSVTLFSEACNQIGSVATHINEHIKQQDNFMKMFAIQKSLGPTAPKLLIPGRVFIKEGTLKKVQFYLYGLLLFILLTWTCLIEHEIYVFKEQYKCTGFCTKQNTKIYVHVYCCEGFKCNFTPQIILSDTVSMLFLCTQQSICTVYS